MPDKFMRCPCKECDRRKIGCHGFCEQYQAWKKQEDEKKLAKEQARSNIDIRSNQFKKQILRRRRGQW
jgi:hypothetical protein